MISDAKYVTWLSSPEVQRCVLAEVKAWSGGAEVTRYLSSRDYTSEPTDTPPNQTYESLIVQGGAPEFKATLSELFVGQSQSSYGDLEIQNPNGTLDFWLTDAWSGRAATLYLGDPSWARSDFRPIMAGTVDDISARGRDRLVLALNDKSRLFNVPVQTNLIAGTTANLDQPIPLCFGQCFNVEPVLTIAASHTYQVHDGEINGISQVRDNGVSVSFTPSLATGTFTLTSAPVGRVTADVTGAKPAGVYLTKCADIVQWLALNKSLLTAAGINSSNVAAFNILCPQTLGLYIRERRNLIDVVDDLVTSVGGFWYISRIGELNFGRIELLTHEHSLMLEVDDIVEWAIEVERRIRPVQTVRLGYARNWTEQSDGLAGAVTEANRALYAAKEQIAKYTNTLPGELLPGNPDVIPTLLAVLSDATAEATRQAGLAGVSRLLVKLLTYATPFFIDLGAHVVLKHPRFGFSSGGHGIVVALVDKALNGTIEMTLWA